MNGRLLLDTNAVIGILENDEDAGKLLESSQELVLPIIALGELYYGARASSKSERNQERVREFSRRHSVLDCDEETAEIYGTLRDQLRKKGRPIPDNDIWIAAIATQHGLTIVTRDKHFSQIEDLPTEAW